MSAGSLAWMSLGVCLLALLSSGAQRVSAQSESSLRPPSVPLVACDPYFSVWSPADKLTGADTTHWTGKPHRLTSLVRIDGKAYRLMGKDPADVPALPQTKLEVLPTRTIYSFANETVKLTFTFMTPALPEDIDILSRPVTYLTWSAQAVDGKRHKVEVYFDASSELTVNVPQQQVTHASEKAGDLTVLKMGSVEQPILAKRGDDIRIDWGYLYVAAPKKSVAMQSVAPRGVLSASFAKSGVSADLSFKTPASGSGDSLVGAVMFELSPSGS